MTHATSRRDFLALLAALPATGLAADTALAQASMPSRRIPGHNESLPVIGLGSSGRSCIGSTARCMLHRERWLART